MLSVRGAAAERRSPVSDCKAYLGDGAYADFDGYAIVLTAENGIAVTHRIVLEPEVWAALVDYVVRLKERHGASVGFAPSETPARKRPICDTPGCGRSIPIGGEDHPGGAVCPCTLATPCNSSCTCAHPGLSGGCERCATYGSREQRRESAERLASVQIDRDALRAALAEAERDRDACYRQLDRLVSLAVLDARERDALRAALRDALDEREGLIALTDDYHAARDTENEDRIMDRRVKLEERLAALAAVQAKEEKT